MGKFEIGHNRPGPGRPPGTKSGRAQALTILDKIFSKAENKRKLEKDLQAEFDKNSTLFFRRYGPPLLPRDLLVRIEKERELDISVSITPGVPDVLDVRQQLAKMKELDPHRLLTFDEALAVCDDLNNNKSNTETVV